MIETGHVRGKLVLKVAELRPLKLGVDLETITCWLGMNP
jgi:hypothetical protein